MSHSGVVLGSSAPAEEDYLALAKQNLGDPEKATAYALIAVAETLRRLEAAMNTRPQQEGTTP